MAQVLNARKYNARMTSSCQSYEASSLKTSWNEEDLLGRGSFATARRCIHDQQGRVVTKCFKVEGLSKDKDKAMMNVEREMKVLYRLNHQHIVAIHGITEWSNCIGIIMEYVEAGNLDDFLWLQGDIADIPLLLQLRFAHQISDGLRYLHHHDKKRSYVHCDLKPENILLTPDLMVKIADFGSVAIATATGVTGGSFTITSTTQHTPFYTAPELLGDMLSDKKPSMDVYSYGMVLYAILTRHPAFSSDEPVNLGIIINVIIHRGQKPKQKYLDDVESSLKDKPEDLDIFKFLKDIMVRCWDFEAKNRPDIHEIYDEIDEKLYSSNKSDVTYHISDLKKNEELEPTPSSVKIELSEFSSPFEVGPQPSAAYLPISEQSTSATSIQDEVNEGLPALQIQEPSHTEQVTSAAQTVTEIKPKTEPADGAGETASDVAKTSSEQSSSTSATSFQDEVSAGPSALPTRESPAMKQATSLDQIGLVANVQTEQSTSATSIQDKVNEGLSTLTILESPIQKQIMPTLHTVTEIKLKSEPADGAGGTANNVVKTSSEQSSSISSTSIQHEVNAGSSTLLTRKSPDVKQEISGHLKSIPAAETVKDLKQNNEPANGDDEAFQAAPATELTREEPADGAGETSSDVKKTSSEQSSSISATSIQDEVSAGPSALPTRESPGLETTSETISFSISKQKIEEALTIFENFISEFDTASSTVIDALGDAFDERK